MEGSTLATLLFGFALGLRHATDADHIAAVSTLVSTARDPRQGLRFGALWGLGHLLTVFLFGSLLIALHLRLAPPVEWTLELVVAAVLVWLGVRTIRRGLTGRFHFHKHRHGLLEHTHLHYHPREEPEHVHDAHAWAAVGTLAHRLRRGDLQSLLVGMAHGMAGTAGLALLVLSSISSRLLGVLFLVVFGAGALLGMVAFSALLGVPLARASRRHTWLAALQMTAGTASAVLGAVLIWRAFLPAARPF
ncbi:MAG: urease accessory protein [Acidobacteriia bacterium]|jgi:ABC-type nickel/cobalt efflux system permease component RcnA|nr:urease accessory protein [Terriglobia bacterium]